MPGLGPLPLALRQGTFSAAEACDADQAARWEPTIQREQQQHGRFGKHVQVTRTPHRLAWTVASAGLGVRAHWLVRGAGSHPAALRPQET